MSTHCRRDWPSTRTSNCPAPLMRSTPPTSSPCWSITTSSRRCRRVCWAARLCMTPAERGGRDKRRKSAKSRSIRGLADRSGTTKLRSASVAGVSVVGGVTGVDLLPGFQDGVTGPLPPVAGCAAEEPHPPVPDTAVVHGGEPVVGERHVRQRVTTSRARLRRRVILRVGSETTTGQQVVVHHDIVRALPSVPDRDGRVLVLRDIDRVVPDHPVLGALGLIPVDVPVRRLGV